MSEGKKTKKIRGNLGETEIEVPQDRDVILAVSLRRNWGRALGELEIMYLNRLTVEETWQITVFIVYCKKIERLFFNPLAISFFITVVEFTEIFSQGLNRSVGYELYKKKKMGAFHCFFLTFYLYPFIVQNWIKYAERK